MSTGRSLADYFFKTCSKLVIHAFHNRTFTHICHNEFCTPIDDQMCRKPHMQLANYQANRIFVELTVPRRYPLMLVIDVRFGAVFVFRLCRLYVLSDHLLGKSCLLDFMVNRPSSM